jgi:hypothetical protein
MDHPVQSETRQHSDGTSLGGLHKHRDELNKRRSTTEYYYRRSIRIAIVSLFLIPTTIFITFKFFPQRLLSSYEPFILLGGLVGVVYMILPWAVLPAYRHRLRDFDTDIQELDFQIDLQQFQVSSIESRAEKILHINDFQLRRYYDLNLSQNLWVFDLGIICILLGVVIIAVSLYLVLRVATSAQAQIVTAILGGTGALFTNIIAAIYLKMNTSASDNLAAFHAKLVQTNRLLLANLLVSRIEDAEKRGTTLATLAIGLVGSPHEGTPPPP